MKNYLLIFVGIVAVAVLVVMFNGRGASLTEDLDMLSDADVVLLDEEFVLDSEAVEANSVVVELSAQNKSGEFGTATLTDVGGKTRVALKLTGAPSGVSQPAHIHIGACPNPGAVKYPLAYLVGGASDSVLDVSLDALKAQLPLAINVHKNSEEVKVYVACGDVEI
ncbi:MAG: hypothetical protein Q7R85_00700 [bacterium]|nr:hypothetical protein [bacterium]